MMDKDCKHCGDDLMGYDDGNGLCSSCDCDEDLREIYEEDAEDE